jgi:RNA polymerase sigma factor (sigma-70 family)
MTYVQDLDLLTTVGGCYGSPDDGYVMKAHRLDDVVLPTGQVVGCDPLCFAGTATPFTVTVPPGRYQMRAWLAQHVYPGEDYAPLEVAALQLVVNDEPPVRWELALLAGEDRSTLADGEVLGHPVDAGMSTLADLTAVRGLSTWELEDVQAVFIDGTHRSVWPSSVTGECTAVTDERTGANVVAVSSGAGDGMYPTFIGYAADGRVTSFVTDFLMVQPPSDQPPEQPAPDDPGEGAAWRDELLGALAELPPRTREVLLLRYWENHTEAQTAETLGCSVDTVNSLASQGMAQLRAQLRSALRIDDDLLDGPASG